MSRRWRPAVALRQTRKTRWHAPPVVLEPEQDAGTLIGWYDTQKQTGYSQGNAVSSLTNFDGIAGALTQGTGGNQPTWQDTAINGHPAIRHDGSDDWLATASFGATNAQPNTLVVVAKHNSLTAGQVLVDGELNSGTNRHVLHYSQSAGRWEIYAGTAFVGGTAVAPDTSPHIFRALFDGASSSIWVDDVQLGTGNPGAAALGGITVGRWSDAAADLFHGDWGEILVYEGDISASWTALRDHLVAKWDIAVSGDATVTPATVATTASVIRPAVNVGVAPAVVGAVAAAPAVQPNVGAGPAVVAAAAALARPAANVGAGPAAVTAAAALVRPAGNVGAGPAALPAVVALPQVTAESGGTTVTPAALAAVAAVPSPQLHVGAGAAVVAAVVGFPEYGDVYGDLYGQVVAVSVGAGPAVVPAVVAVGQAVPQVGGGATVAPATVGVVAAVPQVIVSASFAVAPAVLSTVVALPAAHPAVGASPAVLGALADLARPLVNVGASPAVIARAVVIPTPTVGVITSVTPATVAAIAALAQPNVNVRAGPAAIARAVVLPQVQAGQSVVKSPAVVAAVVALPAARPNIGAGPAVLVVLVGLPAAVPFIPPPVPPPRWVEGGPTASGLVEGVLVGAGIVEGGPSL